VPSQAKVRRNERERLGNRTAQEVLDEHLKLSNDWKDEEEMWRNFSENLRRNFSLDCVVLTNRGVFLRGYEGVRELVGMEVARMFGREVARGGSFRYITRSSKEGWASWSGPTRTPTSG
jgi:hypothetical protein